jgi:hypothetical protein
MLIVPWLCSAVLAGRFDANVLAGLVAALSLFLLREPLIVLARQRWVWRVRKPESETARRCVVAELIVLAVSGAWLCWNTPCTPLFALAAMAVTQTAFAVAMAVRNRQRSLALQISGAITLPATALLPAHAAGALDRSWPWLLWLALAQHHVAAVLVVRSRLAILAGKVRRPPRLLSMTAFAVLLLAGVTALAVGDAAPGTGSAAVILGSRPSGRAGALAPPGELGGTDSQGGLPRFGNLDPAGRDGGMGRCAPGRFMNRFRRDESLTTQAGNRPGDARPVLQASRSTTHSTPR